MTILNPPMEADGASPIRTTPSVQRGQEPHPSEDGKLVRDWVWLGTTRSDILNPIDRPQSATKARHFS
ncbi:MAG: hypothetical protein GX599_07005 [Chloroflexi bacterium]|nr:hypothetical protein [Chloroflexota bacterium]NLE93733.1 hypothetical protein [Chloroflexota bacterium]